MVLFGKINKVPRLCQENMVHHGRTYWQGQNQKIFPTLQNCNR